MGVVHKLKPEVIDFIVQQKREFPKLGCRKLAEMASDKFDMKISKSSVNILLKHADLSNAVGRPSQETPQEKKFEIPQEKKNIIRQSLSASIPESERPSLLKDPVESPLLEEVDDTAFQKRIYDIRARRSEALKTEISHAGIMVLLQFYWGRSELTVLKNPFYRLYQKEAIPSLDLTMDALFSLGLAGLSGTEQFSQTAKSIVWQIFPLTPERIQEQYNILKKAWQPTDQFFADYLNEKQQFMTDLSGFRLTFTDHQPVFIDAAQNRIYQKEHAASLFSIHPALDRISATLISQTKPFISCSFADQKELSTEQRLFLDSCFRPKEIALQKVEALGKNFQEVATFETALELKRKFILGVYPHQKEFQAAIENIQWAVKEPYYYQMEDKVVYLTESYVEVGQKKVRMIGIWSEKEDPIGGILTNVFDQSISSIVDQFLCKYISFESPKDSQDIKSAEPPIKDAGLMKNQSIWGVMDDFQKAVEEHFLQTFPLEMPSECDASKLLSGIYSISGSVFKQAHSLETHLNIPKDYPLKSWLEAIISHFNQCQITSRENLKSIIKIKN